MKLLSTASRALTLALVLTAAALAQAQADPPARVAYISALEGAVQVQDGHGWAAASLNWPVTTGAQLQLDSGARLELDGGWLALRVQGPATLDTTLLDDSHTQWALTQGSAALRLRQAPPDGQRVELDTPQLALVATQPGEFRVDTDSASDTTRLVVRAGSATVYGASGQAMTVTAGQQYVFTARDLSVQASGAAPPRDAFGQWSAARDGLQQQSVSASYLPPDMPGYQALDNYGQWAQDNTYGPVWYPTVTAVDWAPYRDGRWAWVAPWGWTWVDAAPWGFAPFHYGRWAQIGPRWAWVPGPWVRRPVYAPALVQFFGVSPGWNAGVGALPGAAWFPLAPWEPWQPPYPVSARYRERINDWGHWRSPMRPPPGDDFFFQHRPGAISVAPQGPLGFVPGAHGRPPRYGDASHLPPGWMQGARPIAPPARPVPPPPARPGFPPPGARPPQGMPPPPIGVAPPRPMPPPGPSIRPPADWHNPPPSAPPGLRPEHRPPTAMPPPRPEYRPPAGMPPRPEYRSPAAMPPPHPEYRPPTAMHPPRPEYRPPAAMPPRPEFQGRPPQRPEWNAPPPRHEFTRPERPMPARAPMAMEREAHHGPPPHGPGGRRDER